MHTYIIRNLEDHPIMLEFRDVGFARLGPGQYVQFKATKSDASEVIRKIKDIYSISIDSDAVFISDSPKEKISWLEFGF